MASDRWDIIATEAFADDFATACSYHAQQAGATSLDRFVSSYEAMLGRLETFPKSGTSVGGERYRWAPVGSFIAIYRILEDSREVALMRLVYMSSNWKTRINRGEDLADL